MRRLRRLKNGEKRKLRVRVDGSKVKRVVEIRGPGRASSYDEDKYPIIARQMTRLGATDSDLAQAFEVSTQTIGLWKRKYPEFLDALQLGKDIADQEVERALYTRAIGYTYTAVRFFIIEGEIIERSYLEHCPPDVGAAQFWLKCRKPEVWRERDKVVDEYYGTQSDGDYNKLSTDELQRLYSEKIASSRSNKNESGSTRH